MNVHHVPETDDSRAIVFTGNWREFLPIAATNVLLIVVTLGIYRFWAAARERRYLWSRTRVIDDQLEWTGTGKEMFLGFLMVTAVLLPVFLVFQFVFPALAARGQYAVAGGLLLAFYVMIFWLIGFAEFRALRYRLSRSWWHGIRGGSDDNGVSFANQSLAKYFISVITLFIAVPWVKAELFNAKWNRMSFGPMAFEATLTSEGLWRRWLFLYAIPVLFGLFLVVAGAATLAAGEEAAGSAVGILGLVFLLFYIAIPLATLHFYAKFYRLAADHLALGGLRFGFEARTRDWLKLFLGNIGLAIVTLGLGMAFWSYRSWSFMVRHARLYGEVDLGQLTQSQTHAPRESEGFADAFDMGAI